MPVLTLIAAFLAEDENRQKAGWFTDFCGLVSWGVSLQNIANPASRLLWFPNR
jgi:hypothetical protein